MFRSAFAPSVVALTADPAAAIAYLWPAPTALQDYAELAAVMAALARLGAHTGYPPHKTTFEVLALRLPEALPYLTAEQIATVLAGETLTARTSVLSLRGVHSSTFCKASRSAQALTRGHTNGILYAAYVEVLPGPWLGLHYLPMEPPAALFAEMAGAAAGKLRHADPLTVGKLLVALEALEASHPDVPPVSGAAGRPYAAL